MIVEKENMKTTYNLWDKWITNYFIFV